MAGVKYREAEDLDPSSSDEDIEIERASRSKGGKGPVKKVPADFQRMTGSTDFTAFRAWRDAKKKVEAGEDPPLRKWEELLRPHVKGLVEELGKMKNDIVKNSNYNAEMLKKNSDDNTWTLAEYIDQQSISQKRLIKQSQQEVMNAILALGGKSLPALAGSSNDHKLTDKPENMPPITSESDKPENMPPITSESDKPENTLPITNKPENTSETDKPENTQLSLEELAQKVKDEKANKRKKDAEAKEMKKDAADAAKRRKLEAQLEELKK